MLCRKPYVSSVGEVFGCGQCMPCRINKRRVWSHRMELEALLHGDNSFVTLTYRDPDIGPPRISLSEQDVRNWLKRLRKQWSFRYFYCGEYGDVSQRPHYHAVLFGFPACIHGSTRHPPMWSRCCEVCTALQETWKLGRIQSQNFAPAAAHYVAGYVTKKLTSKDDERLQGRAPEFARMSRMPGLAAPLAVDLGKKWLEYEKYMSTDVPNGLNYGRSSRPIGRYMRKKWRLAVGHEDKATQESVDEAQAALLPLREIARKSSLSLSQVIASENATRAGSYINRWRARSKTL